MLRSTRPDGSWRHAVSLFSVLAIAPALVAQTDDDGTLWAMWLGQGSLGDKDSGLERWRWWLDVQGRWRDEGQTYDSSFFRPGIGYAITDRVTAHFGYAFIHSDPAGRESFDENRIWQQLNWNLPVGDLTVQSRTRLEQRFLEDQSDEGWRLRQLFKTTVPVVEDKTTFVSIWDEMFWDLGDTDWGQREGFRQNRAFLGLGQFLDEKKSVSIEVGYLNQWIDRTDEDRLNHVLLIAFFMTF